MATTVLVVEDEQKLRELVRSYLERAGFAVLSTGSGAEAISLATSAHPDLVILDLGLPDVPGESVAREIRVAGSTPILMLTARSSEEDRIGGLGLAAYGDGVLVIDEPRRTAEVRGTPVDLTPTEWGILVALAAVPGRVYSRLELINRVRGYEFEGYERTIDSHVKNLRRKIEEDQRDPRIIQTVLGGGYRLGLTRDG